MFNNDNFKLVDARALAIPAPLSDSECDGGAGRGARAPRPQRRAPRAVVLLAELRKVR